MSWKVTCPTDDRLRFVGLIPSGDSSMSRLCDEFGISRKTSHKWLGRYQAEGAADLRERSSALLRHGRSRIAPGRPQQSGRRERMHPTQKAETASPPAQCLVAWQARFDRFAAEFNGEHPHEGLGQKVPASVYAVSPQPHPSRLREIEYEAGAATARPNGRATWFMWAMCWSTPPRCFSAIGLFDLSALISPTSTGPAAV